MKTVLVSALVLFGATTALASWGCNPESASLAFSREQARVHGNYGEVKEEILRACAESLYRLANDGEVYRCRNSRHTEHQVLAYYLVQKLHSECRLLQEGAADGR